MNSKTKLSVFQTTVSELERGGAQLKELSTIVNMLATAAGCHEKGDSYYWNFLTEDIKKMEKGVFLNVDGEEVLFIVGVGLITADSPAIKRLVEMSTSTGFVLLPCRICLVNNDELHLCGSLRDPEQQKDMFERNGNKIEPPYPHTMQVEMKQDGLKGISIVAAVWMRNYFDYRCLLIDIMHAFGNL
jgi:hypothetical protein